MAKRTGRTTPKKDRHEVFLACLAQYGNVTQSSEESGLSRTQLYAKRREDAAFAEAWDKALEIGVAALEDEAKRRAYAGWEEPVWHKGEQCGTVRKFSDTLLIVLLKAHMSEKYAERQKTDANVEGSLEIKWQD